MLKRTLIAITLVGLLATSAQALGPEPWTATTDDEGNPVYGKGGIKVDDAYAAIWPFEYKALDLCAIPVYMKVGILVQVHECHKRKIQLIQVPCGDIGKGSGDWPCYRDCDVVKVRANFDVKLGLKLEKNDSGVIDKWSAFFKDGVDTVDALTGWNDITVCVDAWKTQLTNSAPGNEVRVGTVILTVKPNV
jgi:hypothetical protein